MTITTAPGMTLVATSWSSLACQAGGNARYGKAFDGDVEGGGVSGATIGQACTGADAGGVWVTGAVWAQAAAATSIATPPEAKKTPHERYDDPGMAHLSYGDSRILRFKIVSRSSLYT
ncbi:hypothetical protein [Magnetospirillum fulvum]|nr:hypothetical protein [Magnetospirillum fulvum]